MSHPLPNRRSAVAALAAFAELGSAGLLTAAMPAIAQERYPNKPLNLIIPFGPGAATDAVARIVGEGLSRQLGQQVLPVNRPGANGMIAIRSVQSAPTDGYNLLFLANGVIIEQVIRKNTNFDIRKDITPVARVVQAPLGLFASNHLPVTSVAELVQYAKANPGKINYASAGVGTIAHLTTERLRLATGMELVHVPYPAGTAPVLTALIQGDVGIFVNEMGSMRGHVADKRMKVLATLADQRSPLYPDAPAVPDLGMPELRGIFAPFFFGIYVEPGTPADRVELLNAAINKTLAEPAVRERLVALGYNPALIGGTTPAEFRRAVAEELGRVEATVREAKIQVE